MGSQPLTMPRQGRGRRRKIMSDLSKWTPSDMLEPVRRFLDGDLTMAPSIKIEQFQDGNTLVVRAEVPGIDPDKDVDVSVSEGMLNISVEREEKSEHKSKNGYRSEFRYGSSIAQHRAACRREGRRHHRHLQGRRPGGPCTGPEERPRRNHQEDPDRPQLTRRRWVWTGNLDWHGWHLNWQARRRLFRRGRLRSAGNRGGSAGLVPGPLEPVRRPRRRGRLPSEAPGGASRRRGTG